MFEVDATWGLLVAEMTDAVFKPIHGRCECGGVRYKVTAPAGELYHCHCSRCRRLHGALFATYAYIEKDQLVIEEGAEKTATYSSPLATWRFCRNCGNRIRFSDSAMGQRRSGSR